jgi:hypothetical protein
MSWQAWVFVGLMSGLWFVFVCAVVGTFKFWSPCFWGQHQWSSSFTSLAFPNNHWRKCHRCDKGEQVWP